MNLTRASVWFWTHPFKNGGRLKLCARDNAHIIRNAQSTVHLQGVQCKLSFQNRSNSESESQYLQGNHQNSSTVQQLLKQMRRLNHGGRRSVPRLPVRCRRVRARIRLAQNFWETIHHWPSFLREKRGSFLTTNQIEFYINRQGISSRLFCWAKILGRASG